VVAAAATVEISEPQSQCLVSALPPAAVHPAAPADVPLRTDAAEGDARQAREGRRQSRGGEGREEERNQINLKR
jgi:hypothetical protein